MIISILGKGGSGKSSLSTQLVLGSLSMDLEVLAIDADHNLDLSFNLSQAKEILNQNFLGSALSDLKKFVALSDNEKYDQVFFKQDLKRFNFGLKADKFSEKYTVKLRDNLYLMSAGSQTDEVLYGKACSHILSTPLKVYLPLLQLNNNQIVIVDEKAGADGVSTGIITGVDVAIIVCEASLHSTKTAKQLIGLLNFYRTPYLLVANKVKGESDLEFIENKLQKKPSTYFPISEKLAQDPFSLQTDYIDNLKKVLSQAKDLNNNDRLKRSRDKFSENKNYLSNYS